MVVSCRAVIGSVAGVRLEQVHLASVAYAAAAAAGRRMQADGYHTLQVMILGMVLGSETVAAPCIELSRHAPLQRPPLQAFELASLRGQPTPAGWLSMLTLATAWQCLP